MERPIRLHVTFEKAMEVATREGFPEAAQAFKRALGHLVFEEHFECTCVIYAEGAAHTFDKQRGGFMGHVYMPLHFCTATAMCVMYTLMSEFRDEGFLSLMIMDDVHHIAKLDTPQKVPAQLACPWLH